MLSKAQFGRVAAEQKAASDWLATDQGHAWQHDERNRARLHGGGYSHPEMQREAHLEQIEHVNSFFSMKKQSHENGRMWEFQDAASHWPDPDYTHDLNRV